MKKDITYLIAIVILIILLLRSCEKEPKEKIRYVDLPAITDTVFVLEPYYEEVPKKVDLSEFERIDTIFINDTILIEQKIDTAAIVQDFIKRRFYKETLFDSDTLGKMVVDITVHKNKLEELSFEFSPKQKEVSIIENKTFEPFVFSYFGNYGQIGIGGGAYYKNFGLSGSVGTFQNNTGYRIGIYYKF